MNMMSEAAVEKALDKKMNDIALKMIGKDVSVHYGEKRALYDVNLNVRENTVTALIGPSGCGKSTFLRCLNRMNDTIDNCKVTGKITLDADDIYDPNIDVVQLRARVGIEVKDRLHESGTGLSGGQQQRLCIARAVAVSPEVILMDEPCSALDPIATAKVEELIHELRTNYTIVIVTHSMQQAARVSQRTAMFHLGHLVEENDTDKMFTNPDDQRTQDYIMGRFG